MSKRGKAGHRKLPAGHFTHLDKIFWPKERFTKGDVIRYYERVADAILPYLRNRPMVLNRRMSIRKSSHRSLRLSRYARAAPAETSITWSATTRERCSISPISAASRCIHGIRVLHRSGIQTFCLSILIQAATHLVKSYVSRARSGRSLMRREDIAWLKPRAKPAFMSSCRCGHATISQRCGPPPKRSLGSSIAGCQGLRPGIPMRAGGRTEFISTMYATASVRRWRRLIRCGRSQEQPYQPRSNGGN